MSRRHIPNPRRKAPPWETDPYALKCLLVDSRCTADFMGACLDTGATRTVIGRRQAEAYARLTGRPLSLRRDKPTSFLFGGVRTPSQGKVSIRVPISTELYALLHVDVVDIDVPLLVGLDILDDLALYVNTVENVLKCDKRGIATPLVRKDGHIYLEWGARVYYTTVELDRLHKHFNHPHPDRLSALLRRANDGKIEAGTRDELEQLTAACDVCQRLSKAPGRFRVSMPNDDLVFNRVVLMDLMYLDGRSVMHIVDKDTLFSAAVFTRGERLDELWQLYVNTWANAYVGHPQILHVDQAPQFSSPSWRALATSAGTQLVLSGVESHNALGGGERYHAFLRTIYRKVRMSHPGVPPEAALSLSVAAMNQTAGPRGLVPTLLVFGVIPRTPISSLPLPVQRDRMQAMAAARGEMLAIVARARLRVAMAAPVPAAASSDLSPGDQILVYREPPVDEWTGPYALVTRQDKEVWLAVDGMLKQFSVDKVKRYVATASEANSVGTGDPSPGGGSGAAVANSISDSSPTPADRDRTPATEVPPRAPLVTAPLATTTPPDGRPGGLQAAALDPDVGNAQLLDSVINGEAFLSSVRADCRAFISTLPKMRLTPSGLSACDRAGARCTGATTSAGSPQRGVKTPPPKVARAVRAPLRPKQDEGSQQNDEADVVEETNAARAADVHLTEVIPQGDPLINTARFQAAARKEIDGLQERGTFNRVKEKDVPKGANIIGGRFVYTLKNFKTADETPKARFVAQGYRDKAKEFVVHNLATLRQRSTRLLVSTSAILDFRLFAHDITQAYLQSQDGFTRQLYLRPKPADRHLFDMEEDELLEILLPLYGVCDAGDYWHATFTAHIEGDLMMSSLTSDPSMFYKRNDAGALAGVLGAYVDDCIMGGDREFQAASEEMLVKFEGKERVWDDTDFVGVRVSTAKGKGYRFTLDQVAYVDNLERLSAESSFSRYASTRASLAWLAHTRPDLCSGINKLAQVTEGAYGAAAIKAYNDLVKKAQTGRDLALKYPKLDVNSLHLRVYADSSFANNHDNSTQIGYIVLLCDNTGRAHVLSFASRKCKRVVRSVMAGEVYAFSTAFDEAFVLRYDLEQLYCRHVPLSLFTDSKQLFDVMTKASHPTEKRLMIDIAAARQAYNRHEISNVGLIASEHNPADPMTKTRGCPALETLLRSGVDHTPVVQWVIRPSVDPPCLATGTPPV